MIIIKNRYLVKECMRDDFIKEIKENKIQEGFQSQPGCVAFDINIPLDNDKDLGLTDIWEDRETFVAHLKCDVNVRWAPIKDKYLEGAEWTLYEGDRNPEYTAEIVAVMKAEAEALKK